MEKDELNKLYWEQELSIKDIANIFLVSAQTIHNRMKKWNIPRRSSTKHTNRTKQKQSEVKTGSKNPIFGKKRPEHAKKISIILTGRKFSDETKEKMSLAKKGIKGPAHNKWIEPNKRKGTLLRNIRRLDEMSIWRQSVFERDGWKCVECKHSGYLQADHIFPLVFLVHDLNIKTVQESIDVAELWDISNGRTLCKDCHKKTESYGTNIRKMEKWKQMQLKKNNDLSL